LVVHSGTFIIDYESILDLLLQKSNSSLIDNRMKGFRKFYESKADDEAEKSLEKLPKTHRDLVKDYKFKFESGVNLKGYPDSIGLIHLGNPDKKLIQVAPRRLPRSVEKRFHLH
jgi:hypothetical protein